MFQSPSEGNKDFLLPTYLLRFNTVSVVAVSNTFPSFVFQCQLYPLIVLCDVTWIRRILRLTPSDIAMNIKDYVLLHLVIRLG